VSHKEDVERPASPAAHTTHQARRLADESRAIRGRVHAVVRRPVIETTQRFLPPPRKELFNARLAVSREMRKRGGAT